MPTLHLSKTELEKYIGKKTPVDTLKDRISYLGTDLEGIEGDEVTVEIFPNRPDLLSVQGLGRALRSFMGIKTGLTKYETKTPTSKVIIDKSVAKVRPYTACALVHGLKLNDERIKEIIDMQEKLHGTYGRHRKKVAIGIYPLEHITLPITYTAKKPSSIKFQPLEADKEMTADKILTDHPTGKEYAHLLQGATVFPVFYDAKGEVLSVSPIINSHKTGRVTEQTTDVFVECSGPDFDVLEKSLNMLVTALADMGGTIEQMELEYHDKTRITPNLEPTPMKIDYEKINKLLGLSLSTKEANQLLEKMGYGIDKENALIPAYRADILHQVDLCEDVAIAYGFENFECEIPKVASIAAEHPLEQFKDKIAQLLVGLGFQEVSTYALTNKTHQQDRMLSKIDVVELANAISLEYNVLRAWMIPTIIEVFSTNAHHEYPQKVFGLGTVFSKAKDTETGTKETEWLGFGIANENTDYTQARQIVEYLFKSLGLECSITETDANHYLDGRSAQVKIGKTVVGTFGEVSPQVLTNWELEVPAVVCELNVEELQKILN